jgi:TPP-dependent pyruvate/acetoin dehydrogenase alpha subunit
MRRLEEKAGMMYALGTLGTPLPVGIGQEGAIAALAAATTPDDCVVGLDAGAGFALALGETPEEIFQRLRFRENDQTDRPAVLRLPGERPRLLDAAAAVTTAAASGAAVILAGQHAAPVIAAATELANIVLAVVITPVDRRPPVWPQSADFSLRECDGADVVGVNAALVAAREKHGRGAHRVGLAVLTPPYAGHARTPGQRTSVRQERPDPLAQCRRELIGAGVPEAEIVAIEAAARDEMAVAARAVALACAP